MISYDLFYDLVVILALATVLIANYTDLKDRIIPNKLTFPMIVIGIASYLGWGAYQHDWWFAIQGGLWAGLAFGIGYGMWFVGGWAGGDVKLYTALGALLGGYSAGEYSAVGAPYPLPVTVLLNGVICLAPVLFIYAFVESIRTPGVGKKMVEPIRESFFEILAIPFVIVGASVFGSELAAYFGLGQVIRIILIVLLILLIRQIPLKFEIPVAGGLTGFGVYLHSLSALKFLGIAFVAVFGIRLVIRGIKVINREVLQEEISMDELKEGMISAETIYEKDGEVKRYESPGVIEMAKQIFRSPADFQTKPDWDKVLADSSLAAGVSRYHVGVLRRCVREGKLEDHIRIKKGMPFAPSFGLGVPIAIFFGDLYWWIIGIFGG